MAEFNPNVTPMDLHRAKESLYDMANFGDSASGIANSAEKQLANKINDFLRSRYPEYAHPVPKRKLEAISVLNSYN